MGLSYAFRLGWWIMSAEAAGVEWKLRAERSVARSFHDNTSGRIKPTINGFKLCLQIWVVEMSASATGVIVKASGYAALRPQLPLNTSGLS